MKYLSLFSGIGGFELGIEQAYEKNRRKEKREHTSAKRNSKDTESRAREWKHPVCIGYSEIDKYAIQIYEKHFNHKNYGDITKIDEQGLPDFDLVCGGFPCQSFSIAGKRGGFEDTRGTLFFDIARIIKHKRPRLLLLENVKGLLSHDEGRTFNTIILTLEELGYDLQWQVLNSKNFGVPQNRERVFIIGHLRGTSRPKVFPFKETGVGVSEKDGGFRRAIFGNEKGGNQSDNNGKILQAVINRPLYRGAIMSEKNKKWLDDGKQLSRNFPQGQRVYSKDGVSATLASQAGGLGAKTGLYEIEKTKIRRLTPTECERLQGFPDGWTKTGKTILVGTNEIMYAKNESISDTQRYKTLGNAVTVNVIKAIAEELI